MKKNIKILIVLAAFFAIGQIACGQVKTQKVVYAATIDCDHCKAKIEKNIPFEKGVKDVAVDMKKQQVTVTYDPSKTTPQNLLKGFGRIKVEAKVLK